MMAVAIRLPADEAYDLPEVPAENRTTRFVSEQQYLQREAAPDLSALAVLVLVLVVFLTVSWAGSYACAGSRIRAAAPERAVGSSMAENVGDR